MPLSTRFRLEADFQISRLQTFNAVLTGTQCGERFCVTMPRSGKHKNERSIGFPRAAHC